MAVAPPTTLQLAKFQSLATVSDVAAFFGTTPKRLNFHLYSPKRPRPHKFTLRKKSGGLRPIVAPPRTISFFQKEILRCLSYIYKTKPGVYGFVPDRNTILNAKRHLASRYILNFDLLEFFPSIHFGRVRGVFENKPFNLPRSVATILAQVCCVDKRLPQGACTSPVVSNLVCRGLDDDMYRLAKRYDCAYSRYADDMTISTNNLVVPHEIARDIDRLTGKCSLGFALEDIVHLHDFKVNPAKTRLRGRRSRQEVTGLVINKKVNVPRQYIQMLRAKLHDWETSGYAKAEMRFNRLDQKNRLGRTPEFYSHNRGLLDYLRMVRGNNDPLFLRYWSQFSRLCRKDSVGPALKPIAVEGAATKHPDGLAPPP